MSNATIESLLEECKEAKAKNDWTRLESASAQILSLATSKQVEEKLLIEVIRDYLASILGSGEFLTDFSSSSMQHFEAGFGKLRQFLLQKPHIHREVSSYEQAANEIRLLALDPTPQNQNKIARSLRNLARPDLAIEVGESLLHISSKNYFVRTTLCAALCDLYLYDRAIEVGLVALQFNPIDSRMYPLNVVTRAYTQRFKRDGDLEDIDIALNYAHESIDLKKDITSARTYIAAAIASGREEEIEAASAILKKVDPEYSAVDEEALKSAVVAAENMSHEIFESYFNEIPELDQNIVSLPNDSPSVFDICREMYGWVPSCTDERNMVQRFSTAGWFFQGDAKMSCGNCSQSKISALRKHFVWFGKPTHYWAIVCRNCRTVSDSMGPEKKFKNSLKKELNDVFPIDDLCLECKGPFLRG